jgi:hypothetical protein
VQKGETPQNGSRRVCRAEWVSAKPKSFAWTLGLSLSLAMVIVTMDRCRHRRRAPSAPRSR